jgi:hypothetical protein
MATKLGVALVDEPDSIANAYLSLLVVPDTLLFHEHDGLKGASVVLGACEFGLVTWPLVAKMVGGQKSFKLDLSKEADFKTIHITNE